MSVSFISTGKFDSAVNHRKTLYFHGCYYCIPRFIIIFLLLFVFVFLLSWQLLFHNNNGSKQPQQVHKNSLIDKYTNILILVPSLMNQAPLRHRVRMAIGLCSLYNSTFPVSVRFFVANNSDGIEEDEWDLFQLEQKKFHDIIWDKQLIDNPKNLTLKIIRALRWTQIHYPNLLFIVKVDIQVFLNLPNLLDKLQRILKSKFHKIPYLREPPILVMGKIHANKKPVRDETSQWYVSKEEYPNKHYPKYMGGTIYILNSQAISTVVSNFSANYEAEFCQTADLNELLLAEQLCPTTAQVLTWEDIFITGVLVQNVKRLEYVSLSDYICQTNCSNKIKNEKVFIILKEWDIEGHKVKHCPKLSADFAKIPIHF